jgi:gas vesicle protein
MRHHDEVPYVIIERRSGSATAFLWGALLGAGAALLLAPRSGRQTREDIRSGALRLRDRAEDAVRSVTDSVTGTIGGVREEVEDRLDRARDAFEAGRDAARRSREEMEVRLRDVRSAGGGADQPSATAHASSAGTIITSGTAEPQVDDDGESELGV